MKNYLCLLMAASLSLMAQNVPETQIVADTTKQEHWEGSVLDRTILYHDKPTQKWAHGSSKFLTLKAVPHDWSMHSTVRFSVYAPTDEVANFVLLVDSETPNSNGRDYFHIRIPIAKAGWHDLSFKLGDLQPARSPVGFQKIDNVQMACDGWDFTCNPKAVLYVSDVELTGPPLRQQREEDFLNCFDWSYPGLEAAAEAWKRHDRDATVRLLAQYFRTRDTIPWRFNPQGTNQEFRYDRKAADRVCEGWMREVCVDYQYPNGDINWHYNHTIADPNLPNNNEWQWQLNRMGFWGNLGRAYRMTKDEKYAQTFVKHLRSWVEQCPDPVTHAANGAGSSWRTIECGIRLLGSWPEAFFLFLHSPSFTDDDILMMIRSMTEQMRHLIAFPQGGNWLTMEMNGVYTCASVFPELKEAAAARLFAMEKLYKDIKNQFLPDGAQFELTPGYHQVALENSMSLPRTAILMKRENEIPEGYVDILEKAYDFNLRLMTPDRNLPKFNDSWSVGVVGSMNNARKTFTHRQDFIWVATDGNEGRAPDYVSTFLPYAGYVAMRSSWDRDANYLAFDVGPLGNSHVHQDKLNLVIQSGNRELIFDDGGGCYESSDFRRYATSAYGHNTILVDGKPQVRNSRDISERIVDKPIDCRWFSTSDVDFAASTYSGGYGSADSHLATHTRQVLFIKPNLFIVADVLEPQDNAEHTYQLRWQVNSTKTETFLKNHPAIVSVTDKVTDVVVAPLLTEGMTMSCVSQQTKPEVLGWYVIKDAGPYRPATTVLMDKKGAGVQLFLTMFMPVPEAASPVVSALRQTASNAAEISFKDGRRLQITAPDKADGALLFKF